MLQNRDGKINNTYFYLKSLEPIKKKNKLKKKNPILLQNRDGKINYTNFHLKLREPKAPKKKKPFFNASKPKANHSGITTQNTKADHLQPQKIP